MNHRSNSLFVPDGENTIHDGIEHEPGGGKALLDLTDWLRAECEINEWHQQKLRRGNSPMPTEKALIL